MYGQLVIGTKLDTRPVEQGAEFLDTLMRGLARANYVIPIRADTKGFGRQMGALTKALNKTFVINVDITAKVNGLAAVEGQSKKAAEATRQLEVSAGKVTSALNAMKRELGAGLKAEGLDQTQASAAKVTAALAAMKREMAVGLKGQALPQAEADLKRIGAQLQQDSKFSQEFSAHMQKMQVVLNTTGAKGEAAGAKLRASLEAVNKSAGGTAGALGGIGRGLLSLEASSSKITGFFFGLANSVRRFASSYLLMPMLFRGISQLKDITLGYNQTIQRTTVSLNAMFKGNTVAAKQFLEQIEDLAVRTPYSFEDIAGITPTLVTAKIAIKDIVPTITALGDAIAASGRSGTEGLKSLATDLLSLSSRGKVTARDLNTFGQYGVNALQYLAQAYSSILPKGTKAAEMAMRDMIRKGLIPASQAIEAIRAGISNDPLKSGQMAARARTWEGALSNIGDALRRALGKEAFSGVFQLMTDAALKFVDVVSSPKFTQWGKELAPRLKEFATTALTTGVKAFTVMQQLAGAVSWLAAQAVDKLPYAVAMLSVLGSVKVISGIKATGAALMTVSRPLLVVTALVTGFVAAYRNFSQVQDFTEIVVGAILTDFKGLSFGLQKIRGEIGAVVQGIGWVLRNDSMIEFGKNQQGLEKSTAKYWDGIINGWMNTGNKRVKAFLTSDFSKVLGMDDITKSLFAGIDKALAGAKIPKPNFGWGDTNQNGDKDAAKQQKKSLQELAKGYDALAKATEESAKRQLDALKHVNDSVQGLFGSIQKELAKYGVFNSPLDSFIARIQKLLDIPNSAGNVVNTALARLKTFSEEARKAREKAAKINTNGAGTTGGSGATTGGTSRVLTTFKTREEMIWSDAFKNLAKQSARVQELVKTQFGGNFEKMLTVMGNTSEETRQRLMRLAKPINTQTVERFANPSQWSTQRVSELISRFLIPAQAQIGPRSSVATISPFNPNGSNPSQISSDYYRQLVQKRAGELANQYLRKIGELKDVTLVTGGGYATNFDFGSIKRTQERFTQRVPVGGASGGENAVVTGVPSWLRNMEASSGQTFGRNCALEITAQLRKVGVRIGAISGASTNAQWRVGLNENGRLAPGTIIRWRPGMGGFASGHYAAIGSDDEHFTESNMRRNGHGGNYISTDRVINWDKLSDQVRRGIAYAFAPPNVRGAISAVTGAKGLKVPKFLDNAMGVGDAAALETGENSVETFKQNVQEMLKGLRVDKLSLPKEWGKPIAEAADNANRFAAQMLLADTETQNLFRAKLGNKFAEFVKQLREATNVADGFLARLKATKVLSDELRALDTKRRARGHESDPFFAFDERRKAGGDLAGVPDLNAAQSQAMKTRAKALDALAKASTLPKWAQGPVMPKERIEEMETVAADLRRTVDAASKFQVLKTKVLRDALDSQTYTIKENARAQAERQKVLQAGAKFLTQSTFDEYAYGRAVELRGKEVEYWASVEVKALARRASALEAFAKANTLPKWGQGPVMPAKAVKDALAQAKTIRLTLNENASWVMKTAASAFDSEKENGRLQWFAGITRQLSEQTKSLQEQFDLSAGLGFNETKIGDALAYQQTLREKMKEARFTYGATPEEAERMGTFAAKLGQYNRELERFNVRNTAFGKQIEDIGRNASLSATLRNICMFMRDGSPEQARSVFKEQTRADLEAELAKGTNPLLQKPEDVDTQLGVKMGEYENGLKTNRLADLGNRLAQVRIDLQTKSLEIGQALSEVSKQQLEWDSTGVKFSEDDLKKHAQILDVLRQIDELAPRIWKKQADDQLKLSSLFDPSKRADFQFRLDHKDWTKEQIDNMLPFDRIARRQEEFNQRAQMAIDGFRDAWTGMFRDVGEKGTFSFNSFLDNMTNRLIQWGADTLSSEAWKLLQNLLTKFAVGTLGGGSGAPTPTQTSGGLSFGDAGKYIGASTSAVSTNAFMQQAARASMAVGARQSAMAMGGASGTPSIINNYTHNGDIKANDPGAYRQQLQQESNSTGNSRRTNARNARRFAGYQD